MIENKYTYVKEMLSNVLDELKDEFDATVDWIDDDYHEGMIKGFEYSMDVVKHKMEYIKELEENDLKVTVNRKNKVEDVENNDLNLKMDDEDKSDLIYMIEDRIENPIQVEEYKIEVTKTLVELLGNIEKFSKNCHYSSENIEDAYKIGFHDGISSVKSADSWFSVKDDLYPNDREKVIVTVGKKSDTAYYSYTDFGYYSEDAKVWVINGDIRTDVIAWKYYPEPYSID